MSNTVSGKGGGKDFDPIPAGMHHAVCYGVVDIGTGPQFGKFPPRPKVMFLWELPDERIDLERDGKQVSMPRAISCRYTKSIAPKSNLRPMLESWRGRKFTEEELEGFDIENVVGANCFLNIIHAEGKGDNAGRIYANVASVAPLAKGMPKKQPQNPVLTFSFQSFKESGSVVFPENMPEWIQKLIIESDEYHAIIHPESKKDEGPKQAFPTNDGIDEDVPF